MPSNGPKSDSVLIIVYTEEYVFLRLWSYSMSICCSWFHTIGQGSIFSFHQDPLSLDAQLPFPTLQCWSSVHSSFIPLLQDSRQFMGLLIYALYANEEGTSHWNWISVAFTLKSYMSNFPWDLLVKPLRCWAGLLHWIASTTALVQHLGASTAVKFEGMSGIHEGEPLLQQCWDCLVIHSKLWYFGMSGLSSGRVL